ncbi:MAG: rhodanese-like domain-containing protein [Thermoplasmatales archaeon]|jgi:rhodanese-related sulfurtransferase|nr:rhodanese-like domain-containing protein [Thermoplasmatales archaeon]
MIMFFRKIDEINPADLASRIEDDGGDNFIIVDVREPQEYYGDMGHIRNSKLIPLTEIRDKVDEFSKTPEKEFVFVCASGERSYFACSFLKDQGIVNVRNLRGGMVQWHLSGLEVEYE